MAGLRAESFWFFRQMSTNDHDEDAIHSKKEAVKGFRSDRREVFVISTVLRHGGPPGSRPEGEGEQRRGEASPVRNTLK